jgi:hypothetical protein
LGQIEYNYNYEGIEQCVMEINKQVYSLQKELDWLGFPDQEYALLKGIQSGSPFFEVEVTSDFKLKDGAGTDYVQYRLNFIAVQPKDYRLLSMDVTVMRSVPNRVENKVGFLKANQSFPLYKETMPTAEAAYQHTSGLFGDKLAKKQKPKQQQEHGRQIKAGGRKPWWRRGRRP